MCQGKRFRDTSKISKPNGKKYMTGPYTASSMYLTLSPILSKSYINTNGPVSTNYISFYRPHRLRKSKNDNDCENVLI